MDADLNQNAQIRQFPQRLFLLYHELRPGGSRYSYVTDTEMFEQHVSLYAQLRTAAESTAPWPELTFDDGHISNLQIAAPILQSHHLTAQFFITAGWTGNKSGYMGWNDLRTLHRAGHAIGAHGMTHKLLTHCSELELQAELRDARLLLEDKLGAPVTTLSLPGGRYNRRILQACEAFGYTHVYTSLPRQESLPLGTTIGRLNIRADMRPEWLAQLFSPNGKLLKQIAQKHRRKESVKRLLGDRIYAKLWALVNREEPEAGEEPA